MYGQVAQLITYARHTQRRRHLCWSPRAVCGFFSGRSRLPAGVMSSASAEREPCAPDIAATAAVAPPTGAPSSAVPGDDGRPMTPRSAVPPSADTTPSQPLNASIDRLKLEQHQLKTTKKQIFEDLRNAERKRKRLRERARQLTHEDLLSVMVVRRDKKKEATAAAAPEDAETNTDACAAVHSPSA